MNAAEGEEMFAAVEQAGFDTVMIAGRDHLVGSAKDGARRHDLEHRQPLQAISVGQSRP